MKKLLIFLTIVGLVLPVTVLASEVRLGWHPNTEPDLAGYKVYYKTDTSGPPYNGVGATEGDSPIDVGNVTEYRLSGLDKTKTYYFVITAYDNETPSLESGYSNEVWTDWLTAAPPAAPGCFFRAAKP